MPGLRVAVDVTPLLGARSGVARCVEHLLDALPAVAPDVTVVPYVLSYRARESKGLPPDTRVLPVPAGVAIRTWGWSDLPSVRHWLGDVDVVHGTNFVVPPTGTPSTVTVHDTFCLRRPKECAPAVRPFRRAVGRAVRRGAVVHVSTRTLKYEVLELFPRAIANVVPFGVPPLAPAGPLPSSVVEPYVLSINSLEPRKRIDHLVRAFRTVAAWDPDIQLVLAGADGAATGAVDREIAALPDELRGRVVKLGYVDDLTRATLLRRARVVAYPSADEGFGFPLLEAMSVGVPIVTTGEGGSREVAGDAAVLIPLVDDVGPLVDALRRAITDERLRASLRERGTRRVARYSWDDHAIGMAAMWRAAAGRS